MTSYDPDTHYVVVRSKRDGLHHQVDLRTLDAILDRVSASPPYAAPTVPVPLAATDDLRGLLTSLVEELERDRQRFAQQIDALQRDHASLRETVRQIIQHSMITRVEAA